MKVSVVISTYNGEKYIEEQMESVRLQTRVVDEVLICDDCSTDNTIDIISKYIIDKGLNNWLIIKNENNKGFIRNFLDGAKKANGDVIFYSDQDDIWDYHKVEMMLNAMEEKEALAIYCLTDTIDSNGTPKNNKIEKLNRIHSKEKIKKIPLCKKLKYARSPGLCLALKKDILNEVIDMALKYNLPHDIPVGTVASIKSGYYLINEVLVHRRVHFNNVSSPNLTIKSSIKDIKTQINSRKMKRNELIAINELYRDKLSDLEKKELDKAIKINEKVINSLNKRDVFGIIYTMFFNCKMINKKLALRNVLSIIYNYKNGE